MGAHEALGTPPIPELDLEQFDRTNRTLTTGTHRVYACLTHERVPCGPEREDPATDARPVATRYRAYRYRPVVLAVEEQRISHLDWLHVASFTREVKGGHVRIDLDDHFHPPVIDMRAYRKKNPIAVMADRLLDEFRELSDDKVDRSLQAEARILRNLATAAPPVAVFAQAQRCLSLMADQTETARQLRGKLIDFPFGSETFCRFLDDLDRALHLDAKDLPYPETIKIGDRSFIRLEGQLDDAAKSGWSWRAAKPFNANELAIYIPTMESGRMPIINYSQAKDERDRFGGRQAVTSGVAPFAGSAVVMGEFSQPVEQVWLSPTVATYTEHLRQHLKSGHALYYW